MKKLILILTLIMGSICVANPDYYSSIRIYNGNVSSKAKENKYISLEKEYLRISADKGFAYNIDYVFKNHSNTEQIVKTSFPIKSTFDLYTKIYDKKKYFSVWQSFDFRQSYFLYYLLKLKTKQVQTRFYKTPDEYEDTYFVTLKKFKKISDLNFNKYLSYKHFKRYFYKKAEPKSKKRSNLIANLFFRKYAFYQNSKKLKIKGVYLTFRVYKIKKQKFYKAQYKGVFTIRFLHEMVLKPKESIKIKVKYSARAHVRSDGGGGTFFYENRYILGTGRSWKDKIKQIIIRTPFYILAKLPKRFKRIHRRNKKYNYYLAKNYEPKRVDEIFLNIDICGTNITNFNPEKHFDIKEAEYKKIRPY